MPGYNASSGCLHYRYATALLDGQQAGGAILQRACQHHAHYPWAVFPRRRPEQHIYGGAVAVFARAAHHTHMPVFKEQVMIRRRDIDMALFDWQTVFGFTGRQRSSTIEDRRQHARALGRNMQHHKHGGRQIGGQRARQRRKRFHATCRSTNYHNVLVNHKHVLLSSNAIVTLSKGLCQYVKRHIVLSNWHTLLAYDVLTRT